ncbi:hypothetical protein MNBD_IGNAVI01-1306 [hydrothermal vent metagenome]|uniref:Secretion system C-terminal sorting domain-containing protein n=1 Tax=hydrothermal vent metagenome TaxID=652676 RepID=A0A3B1BNA8_9ZZZZ
MGSFSAQTFIGKLNPNPVLNKTNLNPGDSLKILAVLVEFQEDKDDATFGNGTFGSIYSKDYGQTILDPLPHNKSYFEDHLTFAQNYFKKVSRDKFNISFTVLGDILTVSKTMRNYTPPIKDLDDLSPVANFADEVWKLADKHYTNIDFSSYDLFVIFHAGVGKDVSLPGSIGNERDLPSVYLSEKSLKEIYGDDFQGYPVSGGSFNISNSAILPETESRELIGFNGISLIELTINGLISATIGSHLGLPDLYDTNTGLSAIGRFGLMDGQAMFTFQGIYPPEPSAWEKMFLGWENPIELPIQNMSVDLTARYAAQLGDTTLIKVPINASEYYLIENRKRDAKKNGSTVTYKTGGQILSKTFDRDYPTYVYYNVDTLQGVVLDVDEFDWALPGEDRNSKMEDFIDIGLVIWHIDERVISDNYETNTINVDKFNRGVAIVEADGVQDIGEKFKTVFGDIIIGEGTKEDTWYSSNPADLYKNKFGSNTKPKAVANNGANSLITMSDFSDIGNTMSFKLKFGSDNIDLINNVQLPVPGKIKWMTTVNNGSKQFVFALTDNKVYRLDTHGMVEDSVSFSNKFKPAAVAVTNSMILFLVTDNKIQLTRFTESNVETVSVENTNSKFSTSPVINSVDGNEIIILVGTDNGEIQRYNADVGNNLSFTLKDTRKVFDKSVKQIALSGVDNFAAISDDSYFGSKTLTHTSLGKDYSEIIELNGKALQLAMTSSKASLITSTILTDNNITIVDDNERVSEINTQSDPIDSYFALSDIKRDGGNYIIQNEGQYVTAINLAGSMADRFPFQDEFFSTFYSSPLSVDINNDEAGDIITFTEDGKILAVDGMTGRVLEGFPISSGGKVSPIPVIFSENGKTALALVTEDNRFMSWTISQFDGKQYWTEENGSPSNASFVGTANDTEAITEFFPQSKAYNWPNPVYESTTNIRYYVSEDSDAEVTIFDLAGDLVAKLNGKGTGGFDNEIVWDVSEIQSGVYFAHLKVTGVSGKTDTKIIKIAVIK